MSLQSVNPFNGSIVQAYNAHSHEEVESKISNTHAAWLGWKETNFSERSEYGKRQRYIARSQN